MSEQTSIDPQAGIATAACFACERACRAAASFCLDRGGDLARPEHLALLSDAAEVCVLTAAMIARRSEFRADAARLAAEVCASCAESCRHFEEPPLEDCAGSCDLCIEACRTFVVGLTWNVRPSHGGTVPERPIH